MSLYPGLPDWMQKFYEWRQNYERMVRDIAYQQALEQRQNIPVSAEVPVENTEPDDTFAVPISLAECYRAQDALTRVGTLQDMGIHTTTRWRLGAICRWHGPQSLTLETNERIPDNTWMKCINCLGNDVVRWIEVTGKQRLEEGQA